MFKFSIDQKVFFMKCDKINCATVSRREYKDFTSRENVGIRVEWLGKTHISYFLSNGDEIKEDKLFPNMVAICDSLTENVIIDKAAQ